MDPQDPGGVGNPAVLVLQHGGDVLSLEAGPRLAERGIDANRADAAIEMGMRQDVLEADQPLRDQQNKAFQQALAPADCLAMGARPAASKPVG